MSSSIIVTGASGFIGNRLVWNLSQNIQSDLWAIDKVPASFPDCSNFHFVDLTSESSVSSFVSALGNINGTKFLVYHAASLNPPAQSLRHHSSPQDILDQSIELIPKAINTEIIGLLHLISCLSRLLVYSDIFGLIYICHFTNSSLYREIGLESKPLHYPLVKHAALALSDYINLLDFSIPLSVKSIILPGISSGRESAVFIESYKRHMGHNLIDPDQVLSKLVSFAFHDKIDPTPEYLFKQDV